MAYQEHIDLVTGGRDAYKEWRHEHRHERLDLEGADLRHIDLHRMDLTPVNLIDADLSNANLSGTWLSNADLSGVRLCGANLYCGHLDGARMCDADLRAADLRWVNLEGANLSHSDVRDAILVKARLGRADLRGVDFRAANLGEAILVEADLRGANLRWADLSGAQLGSTILGRIDLSETTGLQTVQHHGPSTIDLDTLLVSLGRVPTAFLRGCGVQEFLIEHLISLLHTTKANTFCSCYIHCSDTDKSFAQRLQGALQRRGVRCWLNTDITSAVESSLHTRDKVLFCASENALKTLRLERELDFALKKEFQIRRERGTDDFAVIPLYLDRFLDRWDGAPAVKLRSRASVDFSGWENDPVKFEAAVGTLAIILRIDRID